MGALLVLGVPSRLCLLAFSRAQPVLATYRPILVTRGDRTGWFIRTILPGKGIGATRWPGQGTEFSFPPDRTQSVRGFG